MEFPINSMVIFHGKMLVHQRVSFLMDEPSKNGDLTQNCSVIYMGMGQYL